MEEKPKTIEELKSWYIAHNLPDERVTRFFIGKKYEKPKAFGIYQEPQTGDFIVYKNKADGTCVIRYQGKDEAYAVNELWMKLKEEILNQKMQQQCAETKIPYGGYQKSYNELTVSKRFAKNTILISVIVCVVTILIYIKNPVNGYYTYEGNAYYCQDYVWYRYDDVSGWKEVSIPKELKVNHKHYYNSETFYHSYGKNRRIDKFEDSIYYRKPTTSSDDYRWRSDDSWDSSSTDWDSDW